MVRVASPPTGGTPTPALHPIILTLPAGTALARIFNPTSYGATATGFRFYGPLRRFDHQRGQGTEHAPAIDAERGIYYAAFSLSACMVEVFGDTGVVEYTPWHVAYPRLARTLRLLDLRAAGAMRAGTVAAITKVPDVTLSQAWSRFFYERDDLYSTIDGLAYYNAHNDEDAIALYERAANAVECPPELILPLSHPGLEDEIYDIADRHNLIV